jgi:hypothetical protein
MLRRLLAEPTSAERFNSKIIDYRIIDSIQKFQSKSNNSNYKTELKHYQAMIDAFFNA